MPGRGDNDLKAETDPVESTPMPGKILIIDDERDMLVLLKRILTEKTPHEVMTTDDSARISEMLKETSYDVIVTDLKMPKRDGIQVLEAAKERDQTLAVILMTAYGTIESAIEATRKGAFDYITKPFRKERVLHVVEQAMKWRRLQLENTYLREKLEEKAFFCNLIGRSTPMQVLHSQIERVAKTSATVLITGESGTGKELVARAIHTHSLRKDKPFIPLNCSAIPESIIESELFGHLKGSFTGAIRDKKGMVEEAHQGTLFLDEIGDLDLSLQVKLLRLIQEGEFKAVGASTIRKADVRFVAATHQDLPERIRTSQFREDLYFRLNVINIHMPPLRERTEDIPMLANHFLQKYTVIHAKDVSVICKEAMDYLVHRDYPGNVRELENLIERAVIMCLGDKLEVEDVTVPDLLSKRSSPPPTAPDMAISAATQEIFSLPFKEAKERLVEEFQSQYIAKMLTKHAGNVSQAARELGLKRQYLHRLMRETNIDSKTYKKSE
jgi:DNA-binding NtrC family response regulator